MNAARCMASSIFACRPSIPATAGNRCGCLSSSTGRSRSPASALSGMKWPAAISATPPDHTPPVAPRAGATVRYAIDPADAFSLNVPASAGCTAPSLRTRRRSLFRNERVQRIEVWQMDVDTTPMTEAVNLRDELEAVGIEEILAQLDRELIGLKPVKTRIREIASLLLIERIRKRMGLASEALTLHMSFTGNPGTGKTTVALRIASILHRLGFVRRGQVVSVTRDELVGQYIGHTAPKTKEILKKAMGGVLFIDEAYYLHRPDNERDYGQEAIEILLQVMESQREDLVVILAGYGDRMDKFFASNPGFRSRIAHHIDFPDYSEPELLAIAGLMLRDMNYKFSADAREAFIRYIAARKTQPLFSNARSIRNALDRMRL